MSQYAPVHIDVLFLYEKREKEQYSSQEISFQSRPVVYNQAKVPLCLSVHEYSEHIELILEYSVDLFNPETIENIAKHFVFLVGFLASDPDLDTNVQHIPLSESQQAAFICCARAPQSHSISVSNLMRDAAVAHPDALALVCGQQRFSYFELHQQAAKLAGWMKEEGILAGQYVGICLSRNSDLIIAILAAFKADVTYVPIDPQYPVSIIHHLLEQTACQAVFVHKETAFDLPQNSQCRLVQLDEQRLQADLSKTTPLDINTDADPDKITHVIMTTGTTVTPKIVQIRQDSIIALIEWAQQTYCYPNEKVLASTPITFDLSVFEIVVSLCSGATVVLVDSILAIVDQPVEVTSINTVPSAARALLSSQGLPDSVTTLNLAGEALPPQLVDDIFQLSQVQSVFNLYGPSEDTT